VVALEPFPAESDNRVTHPHVKGQRLCAGDAETALRLAFEQGRLADAFCLARSVLDHYNPHSAYVTLDDWCGRGCRECGLTMCDEDAYCCTGCGADYCDECASGCAACSATCCPECLGDCDVCGESRCSGCLRATTGEGRRCCRRCLASCPRCGAAVGRDQLGPDNGPCAACRAPAGDLAPEPDPDPTEEPDATTLEAVPKACK
jgi:hypothetical protein